MKNRLFRFAAFALSMALVAVTGCSKKEEATGEGGAKTFKIAVVVPLTGPYSATGNEMFRAAELAVAQFNDAGGAGGVMAEIVKRDDKGDPKEGVIAAKSVAQDDAVVGVVAHLNSGVFLPASNTYHQNGLVAISPATTNPEITQQGFPEIFRVCATDAVQGPLGAQFAFEELGSKTVSVLHDSTQYGQGLAEEFRKKAEEYGMQITGFQGITIGEADYRGPLTDIARRQQPDVVYFGGLYEEGGKLVRQLRELGGESVFMGADGIKGQDFMDAGGEATEGAYASMPGAPVQSLEGAGAFLTAYEEKYGEPVQNYGPYAYDVAQILLSAARASQEAHGAVTREGVLEAVKTTNHDGVTGTTTFDENGDTHNRTITFYQVENGEFVPKKTLLPGE